MDFPYHYKTGWLLQRDFFSFFFICNSDVKRKGIEEVVARDEAPEIEEPLSTESAEKLSAKCEQMKPSSPRAKGKGRPSKLTGSPTRSQVKKEKQDDRNVRQMFVYPFS